LVKQTHQYNKRLIAMSRLLYWCLYCTKLALIFKTNDVPRPSENSRYTHWFLNKKMIKLRYYLF